MSKRSEKLEDLLALEGFEDVEDMAEVSLFHEDTYGVCMNDGCDYTTKVEPDSEEGWCEVCQSNTVCSGMVLAGFC